MFGSDGLLAQTVFEPEGYQLNQMYIDEMLHFLAAVCDGTATMNSIEGGLAALLIALEAREKAVIL